MNRNRLIVRLLLVVVFLGAVGDQALAQQPGSQSDNANGSARSGDENQLSKLLAQARPRRPSFSLIPENRTTSLRGPVVSITPAAGPTLLPVTGGGTIGRLTKWSAFTASNSVILDSTIYEDKFGKVGIGTDSPASKLTVAGMIEAKGGDGGIKFPDGTVQTTSASGALVGIAHDDTLMGSGTTGSPLGVASPLMVRDLDNPARQPVYFSQSLGLDGPFTVPAGKLLVIEFVSGAIIVVDNVERRARGSFAITFSDSSGGQFKLHFLVGDITTVFPGSFTYGISQMVKLYAGPGTVVRLFGTGSTYIYASLTMSGYFVDVP
jgi:hypothetical protein